MTVNKSDSVHSFHRSTHIRLIKLQLNEISTGKAQCKAFLGYITSGYDSHSEPLWLQLEHFHKIVKATHAVTPVSFTALGAALANTATHTRPYCVPDSNIIHN